MFSRGLGRRMPVPEKCAVNPATRTKEKCGRRERDEYSRIDVDFSRGADDKYCRSGIRHAFARVYETVRQREIDSHAPPPSLLPRVHTDPWSDVTAASRNARRKSSRLKIPSPLSR